MKCRSFFAITVAVICGSAAGDPPELLESPLGSAFGVTESMWGARFSPNGARISFIEMHPEGVTIASVYDRDSGDFAIVLVGVKDQFEIDWCDWANNSRLLCGLRGATRERALTYELTRLVAVNADGSDLRELVSRRMNEDNNQFQDRILDWLPDDPEHVLIQDPAADGSGVSILNVYSGSADTVERERRNVFQWVADGHGEPRLFRLISSASQSWYVKKSLDRDWELFREDSLDAFDSSFRPIGFGANTDELLYLNTFEGRQALFGHILSTGENRLIYANDLYDVEGTYSLGKHERLVAASYIDNRRRMVFFDSHVEQILSLLYDTFPDMSIAILDEDWQRRMYLAVVQSETDPGALYIFDSVERTLSKLSDLRPDLADIALAKMREVRYPAADGVEIPAYLTMSADRGMPGPAIILPHGGPASRDYLAFDYLAQFFAAQGYTVLQSNYRGSSGYGAEWAGSGAFREWRKSISDISDGVRYLVESGIAEPDSICVVGWSYGGYAALMSVISEASLYQCAVSIAGVTDPESLGSTMRRFVGGRTAQQFIGTDDEVIVAGSPLERADELTIPLMLFHAVMDTNVPVAQSRDLARALRRSDARFEYVEYDNAGHDIRPERYRIDMLTRISNFLGQHIGNSAL